MFHKGFHFISTFHFHMILTDDPWKATCWYLIDQRVVT
uniref:Uncharacterized protein n=1 Tax=Arundo donax TaxID=35708 RepID=A0A0A9ABX6_ARUDO